MYKIWKLLLLAIVFLGIHACKGNVGEGIIVEDDLSNLTKPIVRRINPEGIIYNDTGFSLKVFSDYYENDNYALYINNKKFEKASPNYWRYVLSWKISKEFLKEIIDSAGEGDFKVDIRISSIVKTDISSAFNQYKAYISDVKKLEIKRDNTNFSSPVKLFPEWSNSSYLVLRIDNKENFYLAWIELIGDTNQAMFCFSQDGGQTWSQVLNISRSSNNVSQLGMDIDESGHFYMVWKEDKEGANEIYFSRSLDSGATWYNPLKISEENEDSINPLIEVDSNGKIFVVWCCLLQDHSHHYDKIWLSASSDLGDNWNKRIFQADDYISGYPAIRSGKEGTIYLICACEGEDNVDCHFSLDSGRSWNVNRASLKGYFWLSMYSSIKIGQNNKHFLTWYTADTMGHNNNHWTNFAIGTDKGSSWSDRQWLDYICDTSGGQTAMCVNGNYITMLLSSNSSLFLLRSTDEGQTWSYPEFIPGTENVYGPFSPNMVIDQSGKIYIVFIRTSDSRTGTIQFIHTQ